MTNFAVFSDTPLRSDISVKADLFHRGRLGMGWSCADLAQTILASEQVVLEWESGTKPIPPQILSWVIMYIRNEPDAEEVPHALGA